MCVKRDVDFIPRTSNTYIYVCCLIISPQAVISLLFPHGIWIALGTDNRQQGEKLAGRE